MSLNLEPAADLIDRRQLDGVVNSHLAGGDVKIDWGERGRTRSLESAGGTDVEGVLPFVRNAEAAGGRV